MKLESKESDWLRWSLVFVWLVTACASVWELDGQSSVLLAVAGIYQPTWVHVLVVGGAAVDLALGLAMALFPSRRVYLAALGVMLLMTTAATLLVPALWLHPLGPLTKNLPIAMALWVLARHST
nr:DoxX-like family protein [uncultured Albidiferax sp.]